MKFAPARKTFLVSMLLLLACMLAVTALTNRRNAQLTQQLISTGPTHTICPPSAAPPTTTPAPESPSQ